jgi:DNA repair protein RadC
MNSDLVWRRVQVSIVREGSIPSPEQVRSGKDVARLFRSYVGNDPREIFCAVYLDAKHRPIGLHTVSIGTVDLTQVHPREVYLPGVALAASRIVVAHNHPSGDPTPSAEDRAITERLRQCGELLGIELLDHIVIGSDRFYSFAESGVFPYT